MLTIRNRRYVWVLNLFTHDFEEFLMAENKLNSGDTYDLLLDFRLAFLSIKTSLKDTVKDEEKEVISDYKGLFSSSYNSILIVKDF